MVEFALVIPIVLLLIFGLIDFARAVYTYASISSAAAEGVRIVSLAPEDKSDCYAYWKMTKVAQGFSLVPDPKSTKGDSDPDAPVPPLQPSVPPLGRGYMYVWPAVATNASEQIPASGNPNDPACYVATASRTTGGSGQVAVRITYHFEAITPVMNRFLTGISLTAVASGRTEASS
jgi:hypothetical protein